MVFLNHNIMQNNIAIPAGTNGLRCHIKKDGTAKVSLFYFNCFTYRILFNETGWYDVIAPANFAGTVDIDLKKPIENYQAIALSIEKEQYIKAQQMWLDWKAAQPHQQ